MKKFLVIVFVLIVWAVFFWTLYERVPEVKIYVDKNCPSDSFLMRAIHFAE
jgi:hypothetical protein